MWIFSPFTNRLDNIGSKPGSAIWGSITGTLSNQTDLQVALNNKQPLSTNLTSLSGLTFASTSFVKMTSAGTFGLDTNTYLTTSAAAGTYVPYTGATTNVDLNAKTLKNFYFSQAVDVTSRLLIDLSLISTATTRTWQAPDRDLRIDHITTNTTTNGTGFLKGNGANISFDNSTYLTGNQTITLSGDTTGSGATAITTTTSKSTNLKGGNSTTLLGSLPYQSDVDTTSLLSPNTTTTQKFLAQTGTGTNGSAPNWQTIPAQGLLIYYFTNTNSANPASYFKQTSGQQVSKVELDYPGITSTPVVMKTWVTDAGIPNLSFIPAGEFEVHVHLSNAGGGSMTAYGEIWEVDSTGADIGKIGTSETTFVQSAAYITNLEKEYRLYFSNSNTHTMASTSSRIALKLYGFGQSGTHQIEAYVGGTADSHIVLPGPTVDATNFVPYSGAIADVALGTHNLSANQLTSTVAIGTAPLSVTSTTLVPNLYVARSVLSDTVTTNANLTGPITSVGNVTSIASQTGAGTTFVVDTSPTIQTSLTLNGSTFNGGTTTGVAFNIANSATGNDQYVATFGGTGTSKGAEFLFAGMARAGTPGYAIIRHGGNPGTGNVASHYQVQYRDDTNALTTQLDIDSAGKALFPNGPVRIGTSDTSTVMQAMLTPGTLGFKSTGLSSQILNSADSFIYTTASTGTEWPFLTLGGLVIQPRTSSAMPVIFKTFIDANRNYNHSLNALSYQQYLPKPAAPAVTPGGAGTGSMSDGSYYYSISAICPSVNAFGETLKGIESAVATVSTSGANTGSVALTWTAIVGATAYNVYRTTTSGTYTTPALVGQVTTNSFTDTLATPLIGAPLTTPTAISTTINGIGTSFFQGGAVAIGSDFFANAPVTGKAEVIGGNLNIWNSATLGTEIHTQNNAAADPNGTETNATTGWTAVTSTLTSDSTSPEAGTYALKAVSTGSAGRMEYDFTAVVGKMYRISIWAKRGAQGTAQIFSAWVNLGTSPTNLSISSNLWKQYIFYQVATGTAAKIRVYCNAGAGTGDEVYVDNVSIKEVQGGDVQAHGKFTGGGTSGVRIDAAGVVSVDNKITNYNSIATVSNGIPSELATVDLTTQTAAIGATTTYAVPASGAGMYRVSFVAKVTTAATTSSVLGGAGGFQVLYTDPDGVVVTTPVSVYNSATATLALNTTQAVYSGVVVLNCKASTNIQHQFDYTSVGVTPMGYNLKIKVEVL